MRQGIEVYWLRRGRGGEGFERYSRDVVVRYELNFEPCALDFRLWFHKDVATGPATHTSPGAEEGGDWE